MQCAIDAGLAIPAIDSSSQCLQAFCQLSLRYPRGGDAAYASTAHVKALRHPIAPVYHEPWKSNHMRIKEPYADVDQTPYAGENTILETAECRPDVVALIDVSDTAASVGKVGVPNGKRDRQRQGD